MKQEQVSEKSALINLLEWSESMIFNLLEQWVLRLEIATHLRLIKCNWMKYWEIGAPNFS